MITTTTYLDLSRDHRESNRKALGSLYGLPAGTRVIVFVGHRRYADPESCSPASSGTSPPT